MLFVDAFLTAASLAYPLLASPAARTARAQVPPLACAAELHVFGNQLVQVPVPAKPPLGDDAGAQAAGANAEGGHGVELGSPGGDACVAAHAQMHVCACVRACVRAHQSAR